LDVRLTSYRKNKLFRNPEEGQGSQRGCRASDDDDDDDDDDDELWATKRITPHELIIISSMIHSLYIDNVVKQPPQPPKNRAVISDIDLWTECN
jgi:hypothetical protein